MVRAVIALQPFTSADIPRLIGWISSKEFLVLWTGPYYRYPLTTTQLEEHLQKSVGIEPECLIYKVVEVSTSRVIGHIELCRIDRKEKTATVCRVLVGPKEEQGKGYGTQMMQKILEIGFINLGLKKIFLHVFTFNRQAINCYKKVGFEVEATLKERYRFGNIYWDSFRMSVLSTDWEKRRNTFNNNLAVL